MIEQILVEPSLDLPLSQDDLLDVPCDEDDLHDNIYVIPMQSVKNDHAICVLKSNTCAENRLVIHNANEVDELKLLSSLNTVVMPYSTSFAFRTQVESKEREHMFLVSTNLLQRSCVFQSSRLHVYRTRHAINLDMWSYSFSQHCPFPLFWKPRLSSCCAGSTSSKIDAEDGFSSRKGG